jgi:hypothetical protein
VAYSEEAEAFFARLDALSVPADDARKGSIDRFYKRVGAAILGKLDTLYLAGANELTWRQNLVQDAYNLTPTNSPTFVADSHVVGNGSNSYYDTGFNPTTAVSPKYTQNDCCQFIFTLTDLPNGGSSSADIGNATSFIARHATVSGRSTGRAQHASTSGQFGLATYPGFVGWRRTGASQLYGLAQGFDELSLTTASAAPSNSNFRICAANGFGLGVNQIAAAGWGQALSQGEMLTVKAAIRAYLQEIGAIPITIVGYGDSTALGTGATNWSTTWLRGLGGLYTPKRVVETRGVASYTTADMLARVEADGEHYADEIVVFMDWTNTGEDAGDAIANLKAAAGASGAPKWFVMPPAQDVPDPGTANVAAVQAALLLDPFFAGHTLGSSEQAAYLAAVNSAGERSDGKHFDDSGQSIQATYIKAALDGAGW